MSGDRLTRIISRSCVNLWFLPLQPYTDIDGLNEYADMLFEYALLA
jgi:hypothetical protein